MKYFDLSEDDSKKVHRLFSPRVVPIWLTSKHISFCLELHDKIYFQEDVLNPRLIELWFAIKSIDPLEDEPFLNCLSRIFQDKMGDSQKHRQEVAYGILAHFIDKEPEWQRNSSWKKITGRNLLEILAFGDTTFGMPDWQKMEYWRRFLNGEK